VIKRDYEHTVNCRLDSLRKLAPKSDMETQFFFHKADVLLANDCTYCPFLARIIVIVASHLHNLEGTDCKLKYGEILCFVYDYRKQILLQIESRKKGWGSTTKKKKSNEYNTFRINQITVHV
jgi:hypothetical protein